MAEEHTTTPNTPSPQCAPQYHLPTTVDPIASAVDKSFEMDNLANIDWSKMDSELNSFLDNPQQSTDLTSMDTASFDFDDLGAGPECNLAHANDQDSIVQSVEHNTFSNHDETITYGSKLTEHCNVTNDPMGSPGPHLLTSSIDPPIAQFGTDTFQPNDFTFDTSMHPIHENASVHSAHSSPGLPPHTYYTHDFPSPAPLQPHLSRSVSQPPGEVSFARRLNRPNGPRIPIADIRTAPARHRREGGGRGGRARASTYRHREPTSAPEPVPRYTHAPTQRAAPPHHPPNQPRQQPTLPPSIASIAILNYLNRVSTDIVRIRDVVDKGVAPHPTGPVEELERIRFDIRKRNYRQQSLDDTLEVLPQMFRGGCVDPEILGFGGGGTEVPANGREVRALGREYLSGMG